MANFTKQEIQYAEAYKALSDSKSGMLSDRDWDRLRAIRSPWGITMRRSNEIVNFVDKYGIDAMRDPDTSSSEGSGKYTVILKSAGPAKLGVVKAVNELVNCGLAEAKNIVDRAPVEIDFKEEFEAEFALKTLMEAGADAELKTGTGPAAGPTKAKSEEAFSVMFDKVLGEVFSANENTSDVFYTGLSDSLKGTVRSMFDIALGDEIIFFRDTSSWNTADLGLVITDSGIVWKPTVDDRYFSAWEDIVSVMYKDLSIYIDEGEGYFPVSGKFWLKNPDSNNLRKIADGLNVIASRFKKEESDEEKLFDAFLDAVSNENVPEAERILNDYEEKFGQDNLFYYMRMLYANLAGNPELLLESADLVIDLINDGDVKCEAYRMKATAQAALGDFSEARRSYFMGSENPLAQLRTDTNFKKIDTEFYESFCDIPYSKRKIIALSGKVTDLSPTSFEVLDIKKVPFLSFPIGHPVDGELYVGHPFVKNRYLPLETYDLELLEDRLREFCMLAQSLGAVEVSVESIKGGSMMDTANTEQGISAQLTGKIKQASGTGTASSSNDSFEEFKSKIDFSQHFSPVNRPCLPDSMVWYQTEPSWQRLYNQRMSGGLLEHHEKISTSRNKVLNGSEYAQIQADCKLLFQSLGGTAQKTRTVFYEERSNVELSIYVKFAPMDNAGNIIGTDSVAETSGAAAVTGSSVVEALSEVEMKYKEEVMFCLEEEGVISNDDRKYLERKRLKLGISEERAAGIEKMCIPQLTENEQEYVGLFREMSAEGEISERKRRLLERERESLGISPERAQELEKLQTL